MIWLWFALLTWYRVAHVQTIASGLAARTISLLDDMQHHFVEPFVCTLTRILGAFLALVAKMLPGTVSEPTSEEDVSCLCCGNFGHWLSSLRRSLQVEDHAQQERVVSFRRQSAVVAGNRPCYYSRLSPTANAYKRIVT